MNAEQNTVTNLPAVVPVKLHLSVEGQLERDGYPSQRLTRVEARLLLAIARRRTCLNKETLYTELYGTRSEADMPEPKIIDVFVCKLRHKLDGLGAKDAVATVWGRGYQLNRPGFEVELLDEDHVMVPLSAETQARVERLALETGRSVPETVNQCVRRGLTVLEAQVQGDA